MPAYVARAKWGEGKDGSTRQLYQGPSSKLGMVSITFECQKEGVKCRTIVHPQGGGKKKTLPQGGHGKQLISEEKRRENTQRRGEKVFGGHNPTSFLMLGGERRKQTNDSLAKKRGQHFDLLTREEKRRGTPLVNSS